jgi:hypothetical protein
LVLIIRFRRWARSSPRGTSCACYSVAAGRLATCDYFGVFGRRDSRVGKRSRRRRRLVEAELLLLRRLLETKSALRRLVEERAHPLVES